MSEVVAVRKTQTKQDPTLGRRTQLAIWTALIAAAGTFFTTAVPDMVRLFSDRPPLETVQDMIADQTDKLTVVTNQNVEALKRQQDTLEALDKLLKQQRVEAAKQTAYIEMLREVVSSCCTRSVQAVKAKKPKQMPVPTVAHKTAVRKKEAFKKVPQMTRPWQQQVQMQMQEE